MVDIIFDDGWCDLEEISPAENGIDEKLIFTIYEGKAHHLAVGGITLFVERDDLKQFKEKIDLYLEGF